MRTIKFRAQDIASNKWLYGDIRHHKNDVCIFEQGGNRGELVKPETVGQFTGLTDRNGKEIYEGDILDVHIPCNSIGKEEHRTRVVVWNEKYARIEYQDKKGDCIADSVGAKCGLVYYEVVGNIHDDKNLLEKGEQYGN